MARFVGFPSQHPDDGIVFVNPDNVTLVMSSSIDGRSEISFTDNSEINGSISVHGTPLEVATALGQGKPFVMDVKDKTD